MSSDLEWEFIAGKIFDIELPKEKRYLWKYFHSKMKRAFVKYYLIHNSYYRFRQHTGYYCCKRWIMYVKVKLRKLLIAHEEAKKKALEGDFGPLAEIEAGKYKVD